MQPRRTVHHPTHHDKWASHTRLNIKQQDKASMSLTVSMDKLTVGGPNGSSSHDLGEIKVSSQVWENDSRAN